MIRALVVDDDFRVAHIHAASLERVSGFTCVGQAHSAAQARTAIAEHAPDLLVLDIYLPDEDGLSLLRSLAAHGPVPDTIFITAARDVDTVRAAMGLGAIYYLVKPFGFGLLREQLEAYRAWREQVTAESGGQADQATIDALFTRLRPPSAQAGRRQLPPTMGRILQEVRAADSPVSAAGVADVPGMSRPTAQRYLSELEHRGLVQLQLAYGSTGRPVHRCRATTP